MSSVDMVVTIRYSSTKTTHLLDLPRKEMADILRADLDFLKLPHPPVDNIVGPAVDSNITFWWTTKKNTLVYKRISYVRITTKLKAACSIDSITIEERKSGSKKPTEILRIPNTQRKTHPYYQSRSKKWVREPSPARPSASELVSNQPFLSDPVFKLKNERRPELSANVANGASSIASKVFSRHPIDSSAPKTSPSFDTATISTTSTAHSVPQLTRELWDTRRQIAAATARETYLSDCIRQLNGSSEFQPESDTHNDVGSLLMIAETALVAERQRRKEIELVLEDVRRECREPSVVPRLLEAGTVAYGQLMLIKTYGHCTR